MRQCFLRAFEGGGTAEFVSVWPTIEGDRVTTIYRALPAGDIEIFVDQTGARFPARGWTRQVCQSLEASDDLVFNPVGCSPATTLSVDS